MCTVIVRYSTAQTNVHKVHITNKKLVTNNICVDKNSDDVLNIDILCV